jgi:hypothetical protein
VRSIRMPRRGTRSPSSLATTRVSSDRFFGTSTSCAIYRTSVETAGHPRLRMPLRWTRTIPKPPASEAYCGITKPDSNLCDFNLGLGAVRYDAVNLRFCEANPMARHPCSIRFGSMRSISAVCRRGVVRPDAVPGLMPGTKCVDFELGDLDWIVRLRPAISAGPTRGGVMAAH